MFSVRYFLLLPLFFLPAFFNAAISQSVRPVPVALTEGNASVIANNFTIAGVTDDRTDKQTQLSGGTESAFKQFANHFFKSDKARYPIIISIKQLKIIEKLNGTNNIGGRVDLLLSFGLQREFDTIHLVNYSGNVIYNRNPTRIDAGRQNLQRVLESSLNWFNTWMTKQADDNPLLAKSVKVIFTDYFEKNESDTIYYAANRPLSWDDFKAKPGRDRFDAEVFTSVGYTESVVVENGVIHICLAIKTYFPKSAAWVKYNGKTDYALNHEQRHFDIARIIAEQFKRKIAGEDLPVANYDGPINVEYLETLRQAYAMQKKYDKETAHGDNSAAQNDWNQLIDKELRDYGISRPLN